MKSVQGTWNTWAAVTAAIGTVTGLTRADLSMSSLGALAITSGLVVFRDKTIGERIGSVLGSVTGFYLGRRLTLRDLPNCDAQEVLLALEDSRLWEEVLHIKTARFCLTCGLLVDGEYRTLFAEREQMAKVKLDTNHDDDNLAPLVSNIERIYGLAKQPGSRLSDIDVATAKYGTRQICRVLATDHELLRHLEPSARSVEVWDVENATKREAAARYGMIALEILGTGVAVYGVIFLVKINRRRAKSSSAYFHPNSPAR